MLKETNRLKKGRHYRISERCSQKRRLERRFLGAGEGGLDRMVKEITFGYLNEKKKVLKSCFPLR